MPAPFAFVEEVPVAGSPAAEAGLLAGDAILRFGDATSIEDLPSQLKAGSALKVVAVEAATGRTVSRIVEPRAFDATQPHSLLGCQISDQCPARFLPHPAVEDEWEMTALPPAPPPPRPRPPPSPPPTRRQKKDQAQNDSAAEHAGRGRGRGRGSRSLPRPDSRHATQSRRRHAPDTSPNEWHEDNVVGAVDDEIFEDVDEDEDTDVDEAQWPDSEDESTEEDDEYDDDSDDDHGHRESRVESRARARARSGKARHERKASSELSEASHSGGEEAGGVSVAGGARDQLAAGPRPAVSGQSGRCSTIACRLALLLSSAGSLVIVALLSAGPSILAADNLAIGAATKYSADRPGEILPAFSQDLWRLASMQCNDAGHSSAAATSSIGSAVPSTAPGSAAVDSYETGLAQPAITPFQSIAAASPAPHAAGGPPAKRRLDEWLDAAQAEPVALKQTVANRQEGRPEQEAWLQDPSEAVLSVDTFVNTIVAAVSLELVLCVAGLGLALLPSFAAPRLHCVFVVIYPPAAVALWLVFAAATVYCIVFRFEAEALVHRYWQCLDPSLSSDTLQQLESSRRERTAQLYSDVTAAAVLCAAGDAFTVLGLFAVCSLIGWRRVLRTGVMVVSALSAGVGAALLALGVMLHVDQLVGSGDVIIIGIGGAVLLTSVLGLNAARREQLMMLQLYAVLQCLCAAVLLVVLGLIFYAGVDVIVSRAGGWLGRLFGGSGAADEGELTARELAKLLQEHRLATSAATVLILLLLVANASMVIVLRWLVAEQRIGYSYDSVGLSDEDDDSAVSHVAPSKKRPGRVQRMR